jgi:hypothetical protein
MKMTEMGDKEENRTPPILTPLPVLTTACFDRPPPVLTTRHTF